MRHIPRWLGASFLAVALCALPTLGQNPDNLRVLKYADLAKEVRALKGKVAVVYFWNFG